MHRETNKKNRSDRKLAERVASGDRAAFAEFVDLYGSRIQALVRRYASTHFDVEDLVQEIFLDLYRNVASFRGDSALYTWVCRVALNHCLKHCQRRRPEMQALEDAHQSPLAGECADPAGRALTGELCEQVQGALGRLTPEHRDVVVLHELQELTYGECAEILRVPVGTVKSRLHYAFRALKGSLASYVLSDPAAAEDSAGSARGAAAETIG